MKATRYQQVADRILNLIHNGAFKEGDRIPSIRQLSDELHVSVNTIKEAYWKLEDQNYIISIPQSGFYVKKLPKFTIDKSVSDPSQLNPQKISLCQIYGAFQNMEKISAGANLGVAACAPELWPVKKIRRFYRDALKDQELESFNYLMPPGYLPLRKQIARLGLSSGMNLSPEDIIITNGCHEAIYLALTSICKPGDTVVLESPIYFNLLQLLERLNLKVIEIPGSSTEGINLDTLRFVIEHHTVNAVISISNFNNPTGFVMPSQNKKKLVQMLAEYGIPLIEDDIYGDLNFHERPDTCKAHDSRKGNVVLCSSFSKTIAPGLRVGWIAPGRFYDAVLRTKILFNVSTASANQIAIAGFLKQGGYDRHLRKLRMKLQQQIFAMRACILKHFPDGTRVTRPQGGMLLWIELPDAADTNRLYQKALKKNILIAPGCLFTLKDKYSNCMRLNAGIWNDDVASAVAYLGGMC